MYHGIINIYKEAGFTSHDVVAKLRGILKQKKIGHTGTLDPDAVGVLPVCLGSGTRLCDMLTDKTKEYVAELRLGVTTDTQDMSGTILTQQEVTVSNEQVQEAIYSFLGTYEQIPPMYSALKVNGKKLYELAREGKEVERKARTVQIEELEILHMELPIVQMRVLCSKGTYIRTLCEDIGAKLGCGGAMQSLKRTRVGNFRIEEALTLSQVEKMRDEEKITQAIVAVDAVFEDLKSVTILSTFQKFVENGNCFMLKNVKKNPVQRELQRKELHGKESYNNQAFELYEQDEQVRVYDEQGKFYGIYRYEKEKRMFYPVKMFLS
ncbi:MAG: tRNA pseudouridine(55) synthase TruB [Lachnospiraceae bacterium]|nr:tRNA pseudouridine(55) synthase TruB [Lachnospiraceae bacterium]